MQRAALEITSFLAGARRGDRLAIDHLFETLYVEFRPIARTRPRTMAALTLRDVTVRVNETYLRLVRTGKLAVDSRVPFLAYAARVMRSIIVDLVRERPIRRLWAKARHCCARRCAKDDG